MTKEIKIKYFASIREKIGEGEQIIKTSANTIKQLREEIKKQSPAHSEALSTEKLIRIAQNQEMTDETALIKSGDEIAFFPPVTGG